jgi:hypothetical protein
MSGHNQVPDKPCQPSTMLASKATAYPCQNTFQVFYSKVGSWPYPQPLDQAGKACHEQTLKITRKFRKLRP